MFNIISFIQEWQMQSRSASLNIQNKIKIINLSPCNLNIDYNNDIDFSELKLTNIQDNIDFTYFETKKSAEVKKLNKTFYLSKNIKSFNDYIHKNTMYIFLVGFILLNIYENRCKVEFIKLGKKKAQHKII